MFGCLDTSFLGGDSGVGPRACLYLPKFYLLQCSTVLYYIELHCTEILSDCTALCTVALAVAGWDLEINTGH